MMLGASERILRMRMLLGGIVVIVRGGIAALVFLKSLVGFVCSFHGYANMETRVLGILVGRDSGW